MHVESDWDHFDGSPASEEEEFHLLMEELAREIVYGGASDNERPKWTVDSSGKDVVISMSTMQLTLYQRCWPRETASPEAACKPLTRRERILLY